jgi:hypothetical protein
MRSKKESKTVIIDQKKDGINILEFNKGEYTHFCLPTT